MTIIIIFDIICKKIHGDLFISEVKMKIGIIDADLLDNGTRHPNLACEKMSGYYKAQGHDVKLITNYDDIFQFDEVYMSKVFDFTSVPIDVFDKNKRRIT